MRGRSVAAALLAAVPAFCALTSVPGSAEDAPAAAQSADPNTAAPADQQAAPPAAAPVAADPAAASAAPASEADQPQADQAKATPAEAAPIPEATQVVANIRTKLVDPALVKKASSDDLAALVAFYNERGEAVWMTDMGFSREALAAIDEVLRADDWGLSSAAFDLPPAGDLPASADAQAASEIKLDLAILKYARNARGGRTDPTKLSKVVDQTPSLRDPKTVLTEIAAAPAPDAYLQSLHPKHEPFQRLHQALLKARAEAEAGAKPPNMQRIVINMERWRWMPENLGALYVQINVPEFMVYIVKDGKTIHAEKVVVGKPVYATPSFSADLKTIVFNPEWTVPPTIVREDLLPRLRSGGGMFGGSNTAVLKQHQLQVNYNGRKVDPSSVDWNRVNMGAISFTQPPGPTNVLGKVKFLYPNKHTVYMHDTIKRELLTRTVRAEGHHCPRVANPGKVAAVLLAEDKGWAQEQIDKLLATGYNSAVSLDHPIPVHTTYFTAVVDDQGKVETFADIYKLDGAITTALLGKAAKSEAVADNAKTKPTKPGAPAGDLGGAAGSVADSTP